MLIFPVALSVWYYGGAAVRTLAVCLITGVVCDFFASIVIYRQFYAADLSAICSSIMIAMMLPASVPVYIPILASSFAVLILKIPFGGGNNTPFVPAAAGFAFVSICFKQQVFTYSSGRAYMSIVPLSSLLASGGSLRLNITNTVDILTGNIYGPMGTGCVIVFLACIIYLFFRRKDALLATAGMIASVIVFSLVLPRSNGSLLASPVLELSSGSLMFASVFLITDYATLPKLNRDKFILGVFCGLICMIMRKLGAYEEPVCFAVILSNAFSPLLDKAADKLIGMVSREKPEKEAAQNEQ